MTKHAAAFERAVGERLFPGTLNLQVARRIEVREHFRIVGREIGEPEQDLLFEIVRVNGIWAYRIRPFQLATGEGGHGDDVLEIAAAKQLRPTLTKASRIEIELFR